MDKLFVPGKLINMGEVNISSGGPVSNTGIALQKMGANAKLMGKIGDDLFGNALYSLLKEQNNHEGMIMMNGEQTSYTIVIVPPGVDRIFLHNPGANNTFVADDPDYDYIKNADLFHFGYPPLMQNMYKNEGRQLAETFQKVKSLGVTTSLDMSIPDRNSESGKTDWENVLKKTLPNVDLFLPSYEEIIYMIARDKFDQMGGKSNPYDLLENFAPGLLTDLSDKLLDFGAKIVVIKCGEKGFYIRTANKETLENIGRVKPANLDNWANREIHEESYKVEEIASATGSGDSSIAGFLSSYLNGLDIEQAVKMACAVGAQNITRVDALSGIKDWKYTEDFVAKKPEKNSLDLTPSGWNYNKELQQWEKK